MSKTSTAVKDRWNKKNYSVVSAKLPKELVADFKEKCKKQNISQAQIVKKAIEKFLEE